MNKIGLNAAYAKNVSEKLNNLLANYQMYYQNLRGFHWNITGANFFELHEKFEELYTEANEAVDEIAERILTLGETPLHTFSDYIKNAAIREAKGLTRGKECVETLLENLNVILTIEREVLELAGGAEDEGTASLMSDYITAQEKQVWMFTAYSK